MASNPIFSLLWLILLLVLAWPVAFLCAALWVLLMPFEPCCACMRSINQTLEDFTKWPLECGNAIYRCNSACPSPTS
ncbi:hypothetical protein ACHAWF_004937 [Thalassiosira exigua]